MRQKCEAIIIGDSFNNTLGLIRSLGEANIPQILILVGKEDRLFIRKSRYIKKNKFFWLNALDELLPILDQIHHPAKKQIIICTNDQAVQYIDNHEQELCLKFHTPTAGRRLDRYMSKQQQCQLAEECGLSIPRTRIFNRNNTIPSNISYPILLKPLYSTKGQKSDIHICHDLNDLQKSLSYESCCKQFLLQQYVKKEYEINFLGVSNSHGVYISGGIKKIRHYPTEYSPCSFGKFYPLKHFAIDIEPIKKFVQKVNFSGLFSIEFLYANGKYYFLEVNFRNDGLAYVSTKAGVNLAEIYIKDLDTDRVGKEIYMMDTSIDYCHVKDGKICKRQWFSDALKTKCFLAFSRKDIFPNFYYYTSKIFH